MGGLAMLGLAITFFGCLAIYEWAERRGLL